MPVGRRVPVLRPPGARAAYGHAATGKTRPSSSSRAMSRLQRAGRSTSRRAATPAPLRRRLREAGRPARAEIICCLLRRHYSLLHDPAGLALEARAVRFPRKSAEARSRWTRLSGHVYRRARRDGRHDAATARHRPRFARVYGSTCADLGDKTEVVSFRGRAPPCRQAGRTVVLEGPRRWMRPGKPGGSRPKDDPAGSRSPTCPPTTDLRPEDRDQVDSSEVYEGA